ncbi:MAG: thioredoxin fold domain-containing protein [Thiobacillus sp.]|nr:thioredoxin fold domain-containing protein [Thiobacillus sp.]
MKQRLVFLSAIVAWALATPFQPAWAEEGVPYARNLQKDGRLADRKNGVVLVMFSGEYCGYCEQVLNEFLIPMSRNPDYQNKLVMRRVDNTGFTTVKDFDGTVDDHRKFSSEQGIRMVPTVVLFDKNGRQLGKPLVGLTTVDYYGYYLDQAIDAALAKVRGGSTTLR